MKSYKRLLESDTLGSFDFFTSTVCLDSIDSKAFDTFKKAVASSEYAGLNKVIPLAAHEYTHFIDSTSTLWGLKHLLKMSEAYGSNNIKGGSEEEFYKAKQFLEHVRSLRLPEYYTLTASGIEPTRPWQSQITMGKQFGLDGKLSDKPILFSKFTNVQNEFLSRSPISTVSILEASAMSTEMVAKKNLIDELDEDTKIVESRLFESESFQYIYNQNLTEYSVCVHVLANHLGCKDLLIAFHICSIITRLVLNFPDTLTVEVINNSKVNEILEIPEEHEFTSRIIEGVRNCNLGILYYLICKALPKDTHESKEKMLAGISFSLQRLSVSFDVILTESEKQVDDIVDALKGSKINAIRLLSEAGKDNFKKIDIKSANLNFSELSLPPVYLGDGEEVSIFRNDNSLLKDTGLEEIFTELYEGQEWVERFSEACTA